MINKESYEIISGILGVLNKDDDDDYFICKEAEEMIENARVAVMEYEGQFDDICPQPTTHPFKYSDQE